MATAPNDTALRKAFGEASVARIAIVDDGYDPPAYPDVAEGDWQAFVIVVEETTDAGQHHEMLERLGALPSFGDVRQELLEILWRHYVSLNPKPQDEVGPADPIGAALGNMFRSFAGRRLEKLRELSFVEAVAREATGVDPDKLGSSARPTDLADYDLVFLDFFLGNETRNGAIEEALSAAARERAQTTVRETLAAAGTIKTPLFVLISSRAAPDTVPAFRDAAEALASKFRFLRKGDIENDRMMAEYVLASLVHQRGAGDAVEELLRTWKSSISQAVDDMMKSMRRLDVSEYAYLRKYRLEKEQVSLLEYLTWLFNSYLGSFVEERLAGSSKDLIEPLTSTDLPPAVLQPMSEVPTVYSRVTTTQVQNFPDGNPIKIWTGDMFVRKAALVKAANENREGNADAPPEEPTAEAPAVEAAARQVAEGPAELASEDAARNNTAATPVGEEPAETEPADVAPDVLAAISPVCDLVPGRISAKSIILIGGTLSKPGIPKNADNQMLVIDKPELLKAEKTGFQIEWDRKWPVGFPIARFDGEGILGTDYVRVGRLRELYAAELAQKTTTDIARIGVPVAPPFTHGLGVCVLAKNGAKAIRILDASPDDGLAWELYATKSGPAREVVFTEDFIWTVRRNANEHLNADVPAREILNTPEKLRPLTMAFAIKDNKYKLNGGNVVVVVRSETAPTVNAISPADRLIEIHIFGSEVG